MSKKIVIRADLTGKKCMSKILATVAKLEEIKSIETDQDKCTLTVVGTVDPVRVVRKLRKARFAADIVTFGDDKPKEPEKKKCPCQEACEKACKESCEKACSCNEACCEKACNEACCEKAPWYGYTAPGCYSSPAATATATATACARRRRHRDTSAMRGGHPEAEGNASSSSAMDSSHPASSCSSCSASAVVGVCFSYSDVSLSSVATMA